MQTGDKCSSSGTCNHNATAAVTEVVAGGTGSYSGNPDNIQKYFLPNLQYEVLELLPKVPHIHTRTHTHVYFVYTHTFTTTELSHFIALRKPKRGTQTNGICCSTVAHSLTHSLTHIHTHTVVFCCWLPLLVARWVHFIHNFQFSCMFCHLVSNSLS